LSLGRPIEESAWLDAAPCGLMCTADDGTFLQANATFCAWLGRAREELIGQRRLQDLLTVGGRIFHHTHWHPLLEMQGTISEVKLDFVHRDGSTIPMVLNARRSQRSGTVIHDLAAYVARDRDKYERELLRSRKRLEALVEEATQHQAEAKDRALAAEQMIGIVSHDLRNPLSAIAVATTLLNAGELSAGQERTLARIRRASERATRLISDLLDFTQARLGTGLIVTKAETRLHRAIAEVVEELTHIYPGASLKHQSSGEGVCFADVNRLAQLVGNLVSNAVAHGDPAQPITVSSTVSADSFEVTVHNHGSPIPAAAQSTIFKAMTRGSNAPVTGRSVGLGLFIVSEIAKAHGGRAEIDSSAERGTTFRTIFPRT
jgi:phosphoserine phosphatase RsbU/P